DADENVVIELARIRRLSRDICHQDGLVQLPGTRTQVVFPGYDGKGLCESPGTEAGDGSDFLSIAATNDVERKIAGQHGSGHGACTAPSVPVMDSPRQRPFRSRCVRKRHRRASSFTDCTRIKGTSVFSSRVM